MFICGVVKTFSLLFFDLFVGFNMKCCLVAMHAERQQCVALKPFRIDMIVCNMELIKTKSMAAFITNQ